MIVSPKDPLAARESVSPAVLAGHTHLLPKPG